ncbi:MAG: class I SAM-dependent methyltransferase [Acidobacteria bacterium]|nr:class I SAM-dependent methyltransferase [Acidobacteriota bacterium]
MKSVWAIEQELGDEFQTILQFDRQQIDNPDKYYRERLQYLDRLRVVFSILKGNFPNPEVTRVGDFGCAQGNFSLLLAESGYDVVAVDANPLFVEYSKRKYEKGKVQWIVGEIETLQFPSSFLDAAILGEIITTCQTPEALLAQVLRFVRPGGILIVTLPNASRIRMDLPAWRRFRNTREPGGSGAMPIGINHLFKMDLEDLQDVVSPQAVLVEAQYCCSTILINKYSQWLIRLFPVSWIQSAIQSLAGIPIINQKTFHNLCVVFRKNDLTKGGNTGSE